MKTKIYRIQGKFVMGDSLKPFTIELKATSEEDLKEKIYSEFGSKHHISRNQIKIGDIKEISPDEVLDPIIKTMTTKE
jgi:large subunit ribosomal protein LX